MPAAGGLPAPVPVPVPVPVLPRGLVDLDPARLPTEEVAVLIVGSGVAGLSVALELPAELPVLLATKGPLAEGATRYAQGGIAAVLPGGPAGHPAGADPADSFDAHLADTLAAGAGLVDVAAAGLLVREAGAAIARLLGHGARFDTDGEGGRLALAREGGHSRPRILHAGGDATGAEIERALIAGVRAAANLRVAEDAFLVDLLTGDDGAVRGALLLLGAGPGAPTGGRLVAVRAGAVVLASGGAGQLYAATTNPAAATGDGIAVALRAGAALADLEFVQFHPTALHLGRDPRPLLSEALRGEGAILRDPRGDPVMAGVHPMGDLAPRDVVTRAMARRMALLGTDHLLLDATGLSAARLRRRFPTIVAACHAAGLDPATTPLPVSPAAHYLMGGIRTDLDGRASVEGLFAVGEAACTGVHGGNRLASNSLLEGAVFGARAARALLADRPWAWQRRAGRRWAEPLAGAPAPDGRWAEAQRRAVVRRAMTAGAGVLRGRDGLARTVVTLTALGRVGSGATGATGAAARAALETANLAQLGAVLASLAARREESRGAHWREDAPEPSPAWRVRQVATRAPDGHLCVETIPVGAGRPDPPPAPPGSGQPPIGAPAAPAIPAQARPPGLWTAPEPGPEDVAMSAARGARRGAQPPPRRVTP